MTKLIVILMVGMIFEAIGVVYLNKGLRQVGEVQKITVSEVLRVIKRGVTNANLLLGMVFETAFFGILVFAMAKGGDVSFIWPLTAMGFIFTTAAARFILREEVSWLRWTGVFLIMIGAAVVTYTEKIKDSEKKAQVEGRR